MCLFMYRCIIEHKMAPCLKAESDPIDDYHNRGVNTAVKLCKFQLLELFCKVR